MDFDQVLVEVGEFGAYQKLAFTALSLTLMGGAFNGLSIVFMGAYVDHWCAVPSLDANNLTHDLTMNLTIPVEEYNRETGEVTYSHCLRYSRNYSSWSGEDVYKQLTDISHYNDSVEECEDGWEYDTRQYKTTIMGEWDLVCEHSTGVATSQTISTLGSLVGLLLSGIAADRFGRRHVIGICVLSCSLCNFGLFWASSYAVFVLIKFLIGMFGTASFIVSFVLLQEMVGPWYREQCSVAFHYFWPVGMMIMAGLAYWLRYWRQLQLALAVCYSTFCLIYFVIDESPRWLLANNHHTKALYVVHKMAKRNNSYLASEHTLAETGSKTPQRVVRPWEIFTHRYLLWRSLGLGYIWITNSLVYYGLSLSSSFIGKNDYLSFLLSGLVEFPAIFICHFALIYSGRRGPLAACMITCGLVLLTTIAVPPDVHWAMSTLSMIGKFGIVASIVLLYNYTAELYPTVLRSTGQTTCALLSTLGAAAAPFVAALGVHGAWLPLTIFGAFALSAGLLVLVMPETRGVSLPDTLTQGEQTGKSTKPIDETSETVSNVQPVDDSKPDGLTWDNREQLADSTYM